MVNNHSIPSRPPPLIPIPPNTLRELRIRITQKQNLILDPIDFAPRTHDPGIVCREDSDDVHFLFAADCFDVFDVAGEMAD